MLIEAIKAIIHVVHSNIVGLVSIEALLSGMLPLFVECGHYGERGITKLLMTRS
jgi:hypothetical protein